MTTWYVIKRLLKYVAPYKFRLGGLILIAIAGVMMEVLKPLPIKIVIDNVITGYPLPGILTSLTGLTNPFDKTTLLLFCIGAIVFITVFGSLVSLIVTSMTVSISQRLVYDLSVDLFSKLQSLSLSYYVKNKVGDLLQRITGDAFVVYFLVAQIAIPIITSLLCLSVMFFVMAKIDLTLALIAISVVPLLGIALAIYSKPMNDSTMFQYQSQGSLSAFLQQSLSSMKIIQAFARESYMFDRLGKHAWEFGKAFQKATFISTKYNQLVLLITGLASAVMIGLGAVRGIQGHLSAGDLYVFLGYITALYGPVNSLSTAIGTSIAIGARGKRIFQILDSEETVKQKPHAHVLQQARGDIEFENVEFGYERDTLEPHPILRNVNLRIKSGQIVAIVGPTGAGKTSLISLIARFYDPWKGRITLDGKDLKELSTHSLREQISLVLQEPFLFPMTIADNIAFGNPLASFDEITEAAKAAQAHDFIMKLPDQYQTMVSEMGSSLSGGEKQRIAMARALLKKSSILILDEPTSALDALTEARLFRALTETLQDRTIIIISHRLSTIKHADQIIAIKDGQVVETGTHEFLLSKGNIYADLYKYQHIT